MVGDVVRGGGVGWWWRGSRGVVGDVVRGGSVGWW